MLFVVHKMGEYEVEIDRRTMKNIFEASPFPCFCFRVCISLHNYKLNTYVFMMPVLADFSELETRDQKKRWKMVPSKLPRLRTRLKTRL